MKIIPLSEIRNTAAVSKLVMENSPVFVTKQGVGGENTSSCYLMKCTKM